MYCPMWAMHLIHLPGSSRSVSQVCHESTVPGVLCVSSGDLISGCDTYGRYQLSRIPGRRGEQLGACSQFGGRCRLWGQDCSSPLPSSSGSLLFRLCGGRSLYDYMTANLLFFGILLILWSVSVAEFTVQC